MKIDLHTHSWESDGDFAPEKVVDLAVECGVSVLALTDHDTLQGNLAARKEAVSRGIRFIPGIELSCNWGKLCIHITGLKVDPEDKTLNAICEKTLKLREERAVEIDRRFQKLGIAGILDLVKQMFPEVENISRAHFARALIERAIVKNEQQAFDRYLGTNAPAYVPAAWVELPEAVKLIKAAGGIPVLAHPMRYKFRTDLAREALVQDFVEAGGIGLEVTSGSQSPHYSALCEQWVRRYGLYASTGSDFHRISKERPMIGAQTPLPEGLPCVLELF